jgi:hypothetical protein
MSYLYLPQIVKELDQPARKIYPQKILYRIRNISVNPQFLRKMDVL